tara:strand:+ start:247 stop:495 length:249 start_codon:yes stop_codon:yes gene_type:complete
MTWKEYLISKKIDPDRFKSGNNRLFREFDLLFSQLHPDSFTAQKLYLINKIRRQYKLESEDKKAVETPVKKPKPKMAPRIKR